MMLFPSKCQVNKIDNPIQPSKHLCAWLRIQTRSMCLISRMLFLLKICAIDRFMNRAPDYIPCCSFVDDDTNTINVGKHSIYFITILTPTCIIYIDYTLFSVVCVLFSYQFDKADFCTIGVV